MATQNHLPVKTSGGIISQRFFLPGEDPDLFTALQDDLRLSLRPMGAMELLLVEKIAMVIWKQRRLMAAENASIQLATSPGQCSVRSRVSEAMGYTSRPSAEDLSPVENEDADQIEWCKDVIIEAVKIPQDVDLVTLAKLAPTCHQQFLTEAKEEGIKPEIYLASLSSLYSWVIDLLSWCKKEFDQYERREKFKPFLQLVQIKEVAHVGMQMLNTFQTALDTELYRAMDALRKQQEWRQKNGIDLAVVADEQINR